MESRVEVGELVPVRRQMVGLGGGYGGGGGRWRDRVGLACCSWHHSFELDVYQAFRFDLSLEVVLIANGEAALFARAHGKRQVGGRDARQGDLAEFQFDIE